MGGGGRGGGKKRRRARVVDKVRKMVFMDIISFILPLCPNIPGEWGWGGG